MPDLWAQCAVCGGPFWRPTKTCTKCGAYVGADGQLHEPKPGDVPPPAPKPTDPAPPADPAADPDRWP